MLTNVRHVTQLPFIVNELNLQKLFQLNTFSFNFVAEVQQKAEVIFYFICLVTREAILNVEVYFSGNLMVNR